MDAHERWHVRVHFAFVQHNEFLVAGQRSIARDPEIAAFCREFSGRHELDRFGMSGPRAIVISFGNVRHSKNF
jgi:hypothetical protein